MSDDRCKLCGAENAKKIGNGFVCSECFKRAPTEKEWQAKKAELVGLIEAAIRVKYPDTAVAVDGSSLLDTRPVVIKDNGKTYLFQLVVC